MSSSTKIVIGIAHIEELCEDLQELEVYDLTDGDVDNFTWITEVIKGDLLNYGEFDAVITAARLLHELHGDLTIDEYIPHVQTTYELPTYHNVIDIIRKSIDDRHVANCECDIRGGRLILRTYFT